MHFFAKINSNTSIHERSGINMKSLGIVRKVDELGRIVLPKEIRTSFELDSGDGVEIFVEKDKIILQKYAPACVFCGEADDIVMFKNKRVCRHCLEEIAK